MKLLLFRWLMRITHSFAPNEVKVDIEQMEEWLKGLASQNSGYKHYYTLRKKLIQENLLSGIPQEQYWFLCGQLHELKYINQKVVEALKKDKKYAIKERKKPKDDK